ncbi:nuclear transcription factor, X-box binding-like 1 [Haematococcus lacustris]|uniref:Nuclear transcription factor, X-box binding-like 1 n=1 Tax=Haematococcus lacustris TaxID=44745 RepID=A0A6A0A334_HAELA|nr:nuclear transcription factor, X-box binding-like 1 [Haematococcus lacustris]
MQVVNRWIAFLPDPSLWPNDGQTFAQVVHTDGVTVSVLFTRPKPARPPGELPRMGKQEGAVNPLAHLDADWLAATRERRRYREYVAMTLVTWPAMWAEMSKPRWSNARFRLYGGKRRTVAKFWAETVRGAMVRCNSAATGRPLALAYGAAGFSGGGSMSSRGVPVKQMLREAYQQFPGRVLMVHEFRTSRVSSARTNMVAGHAEGFRDAVFQQGLARVREFLAGSSGDASACLICLSAIKPREAVWACAAGCCALYHLPCIQAEQEWARNQVDQAVLKALSKLTQFPGAAAQARAAADTKTRSMST